MSVTTLIGAQFGSEGKGHVAAALAKRGAFAAYVRTGGPNAGHTYYHRGRKFVSRSVPVGWIDPEATLFIGPGAVIDPHVLRAEIEEIQAAGDWNIRERLYIDHRASVILPQHQAAEGGVEGMAHRMIGSTGEGVGMTRMARINRGSIVNLGSFAHQMARDCKQLEGLQITDVPTILASFTHVGDKVLLEGTQGSGLSMTTGPWPYTTSADTNSAQLLADAGISPGHFERCILVARTFPIRVAGNSGPLPNETTWEDLGFPPEKTTVTQKVRRVAGWHNDTVRIAVSLNKPCQIVVTFMDYLFADMNNCDVHEAKTEALASFETANVWLDEVEREVGAPVVGFATGPDTIVWRREGLL